VQARVNTQISISPRQITSNLNKNAPSLNLSTEEWHIQIKAEKDIFKDYINYAGVRRGASNECDILDIGEPPSIGNFVSVYFDHSDWKEGAGLYTSDFRTLDVKGYEYNFTVESNFEGQTTLTLESQNLPENLDWTVVSTVTKVRYSQKEITTPLKEQNYRLLVGTPEFLEDAHGQYKEAPTNFQLSQNYPNPFNPETTILFQLPREERITVAIYNLLGQKVKTILKNELKEPGYYNIRWDGTNEEGYRAASGLYILLFRSENYVKSIKMMLLR